MSEPAKACFKCLVVKPLSDYYRHPQMGDGRLGKCKECTKRDVQENYRRDPSARAAYEIRRNQDPERRAAAKRYQKASRLRDPMKYEARMAVSNAVRDGRLTRMPCEKCGTTVRVHGHHDDYNKPLDVRWLCHKHHMEHHGKSDIQIERPPERPRGRKSKV